MQVLELEWANIGPLGVSRRDAGRWANGVAAAGKQAVVHGCKMVLWERVQDERTDNDEIQGSFTAFRMTA
jgi:hypothetical protein